VAEYRRQKIDNRVQALHWQGTSEVNWGLGPAAKTPTAAAQKSRPVPERL